AADREREERAAEAQRSVAELAAAQEQQARLRAEVEQLAARERDALAAQEQAALTTARLRAELAALPDADVLTALREQVAEGAREMFSLEHRLSTVRTALGEHADFTRSREAAVMLAATRGASDASALEHQLRQLREALDRTGPR
ncbi:MAG: hypothetical protein JWM71_2605, partial [Solirubrobacteraceae bacterium]|nr:hypothetical protein [Solirubrobacteraceae bacterium]